MLAHDYLWHTLVPDQHPNSSSPLPISTYSPYSITPSLPLKRHETWSFSWITRIVHTFSHAPPPSLQSTKLTSRFQSPGLPTVDSLCHAMVHTSGPSLALAIHPQLRLLVPGSESITPLPPAVPHFLLLCLPMAQPTTLLHRESMLTSCGPPYVESFEDPWL